MRTSLRSTARLRAHAEKVTKEVSGKEYDRLALAVETGTTTIDEIVNAQGIDEGQKATLIKRWQERNALGTYDTAVAWAWLRGCEVLSNKLLKLRAILKAFESFL